MMSYIIESLAVVVAFASGFMAMKECDRRALSTRKYGTKEGLRWAVVLVGWAVMAFLALWVFASQTPSLLAKGTLATGWILGALLIIYGQFRRDNPHHPPCRAGCG